MARLTSIVPAWMGDQPDTGHSERERGGDEWEFLVHRSFYCGHKSTTRPGMSPSPDTRLSLSPYQHRPYLHFVLQPPQEDIYALAIS